MGYANCDRIMNTDNLPLTNVKVVLPDATFIPGGSGLQNANTEIYFLLPSAKVVLGDGPYDASTNTVTMMDDGSKVPVGWNYEVVLIANRDGQYYYWQSSGTTTAGMILTAVPGPDSQGDIMSRINGL